MPKPPTSFDHALIDPASKTLFLADRSNSGIDVITLQGELFVRTIGGFVGLRGPADSGPNDLALVPELNQLWVTDGDSSVKVIDLATRSVVATVPTGGRGRADDIAYDARDKLIAVGNDSDAPPFLTFISVADRKTIGTLEFPGAGGLEAVLWSADRGVLYQAVPSTKTNPGGEIDLVDPKVMKVTKVFALRDCNPHGIAIGPRGQMLLGCSPDALTNGARAQVQVIDMESGNLVAAITETGAADIVWYNPGANQYFVAASGMTADGTKTGAPTPALGIIDAASNRWLQNVSTFAGAHSVVGDPATNHVYVPLPAQGFTVLGGGSAVLNVDR